MVTVCETCLEYTWVACIEVICSEAVATNICDTIETFWDPLVKLICGLFG